MYYKNNIIKYLFCTICIKIVIISYTGMYRHAYRASRTASILLDTVWKAVIGRLEPYQTPKTMKKQLNKPVIIESVRNNNKNVKK